MNTMQTSQTKAQTGIEDLLKLIRQELGNRTPPEHPLEYRGPPPDAPKPMGMWELRNQMRESTLTNIRELVSRMRQSLFLLTDSQQQTLRDLDIPQLDELLSLVGRSMPQDYQIRQRLDTIMNSIPGDRDWTQWWINTALNPGPGIHRPQDHDPETDPVAGTLNQVIRKIGLRALQDLPSHTTIAWEIAAGNLRTSSGQHYLKLQNEQVPLAGVMTVYRLTRELAERMLVRPDEIPAANPSPEQVQEELEQEGLDILRDAGTVTTLAALRRDIGVNTLDTITINIQNRQWVHQRVPNGDRIAPWHFTQSNLEGKIPEPVPENGLGSAEWELIRITVPSHPELNSRDNWTQSRNARIVGYLTGTTPEHVIIYMSGETNHTTGITRPACPMASKCPTHCGIAQAQGTHTFPFTHDGKFESCRYHRFLKQHGNASPETREAFDNLNIQLTLRALIKDNQKKHVRLVPQGEEQAMNGTGNGGSNGEGNESRSNRKPSPQSLML